MPSATWIQHPDKSLRPLLARLPTNPFPGEMGELPLERERRRGLKVGRFGGWSYCYDRKLRHLKVGGPLQEDQTRGTQEPPALGEEADERGGGMHGLESQAAKYGIYPPVLLRTAWNFTHRRDEEGGNARTGIYWALWHHNRHFSLILHPSCGSEIDVRLSLPECDLMFIQVMKDSDLPFRPTLAPHPPCGTVLWVSLCLPQ